MAKNFNVTFSILGNENVSAAVNAAQNALRSLSGAQRTLNARLANQQRAIANAQDLLKQIGNYKKLQQAIENAQSARAKELLTASRSAAAQSQARKQLDAMRESYKALQKYQRGERANLDTDKLSVAKLKSAISQSDMSKGAADVMRAQIRAAEQDIKAREKNLNQIMRSAQNDLRGQEAVVKNFGSAFDAANQKANQLRATLASQQSQLATLRSQGLSGNIAAQEASLRAQIQQTTNAINQETAALQRRNQAAQNFHNAEQNLSNAYSNFQNATQTADTLMSPFVKATEVSIDFEHQMSRVKAVTQMRNIREGNFAQVAADMNALTTQAERLGATTEFTSLEIGKGMEKYGYAGWTAAQIKAAMNQTVDLATISPTHNVELMADMLSDISTAMGIKAGDTVKLANGKVVDAYSHFADSWAYATTTANLNDQDLFTALKYNAGAMNLAGLTHGDIFAANMLVANAGLKGSMAGTAFRSGMIRLQAPPKAGAKALEEMGFNASEAQKQMAAAGEAMHALGIEGGSVMDKIVAIKQRYDELGESGNSDAQVQMINDIFGKNAFQAWAEVFRSGNLDHMKQIADEINSGYVEGWTADTAAVMRDNTKTQIEYVKSAWDALLRSLGDAFLLPTENAAGGLANMLSSLSEWIAANQTAVQWAGLLAAAISGIVVAGAGIAVLGAAFTFISSGLAMLGNAVMFVAGVFRIATAASAVWGAITAGVAMLASAPIWAIVAAIAAVIGIIGYATGAFDGLGSALANAFNHPKGAITGLCEFMKSSITSAVDYVQARLITLGSALKNPLQAAINFARTGSVVGGDVINGTAVIEGQNAAANYSEGGGVSAIQARIDTSPIQNAADNLSASMSNAAMGTENFSASMSNVAMGTENFSSSMSNAAMGTETFSSSMMNAAMGTEALSMSTMNASMGADALGMSAQTATGGVDAMSASAAASTGSISSMSGASSSAAGSISGLGAAASAAIGALMNAASSAASTIGGLISSASASISAHFSVAHNAEGGIYQQGSFLTTFAESSPEAAIPIEKSARAQSLWLETGELLGMFDGNSTPAMPGVNVTMNINVAGGGGEEIKNSISDWLPQVRETFEDMLDNFYNERTRRSFA